MPETIRECYGYTVVCRPDPKATEVVERFFGPPQGTPATTSVVRLDLIVADAEEIGPLPPPYFPAGWESSDEIVIRVGESEAVVRPDERSIGVRLAAAAVDDSVVWGRWLLEKAFLLLTLRSSAHYGLHAGGVTIAGRAALFTADSGVGKSTFGAWAMRRGALFAGEDAMIRHLDDPSGTFFGYPRAAYLGSDLLDRWPQLAHADRDPVPGRDKARVQWPPPMLGGLRSRVDSAALLFLTRDHRDIRSVPVAEAVERCWPDVAAGKSDPEILAAVRADLTAWLSVSPVLEFGLDPDLDVNFDRLAALLHGA